MKYALAILLVILCSYSDIFLFRIGIVPVEPSGLIIPLFIAAGFVRYSIKDFGDLVKTHTFSMFFWITIMALIYSGFTRAHQMVVITEIVLNIITLLMYLIAVQFFRKEDKTLVIATICGGFLVLGGSVLYDFFIGLPNYSMSLAQSVRKGGFGENPNQAASGIKFLALASLVHLTDKKLLKNFVIIFMLFSVFMTFSRSGLVSVIFILMLGSINSWNHRFGKDVPQMVQNSFKLMMLLIGLYLCLLVIASLLRANFPQFTRGDAGKRLDLLTGKVDKRNVGNAAVEGGRADLLFEYYNRFKQNPLGHGTGYSSDKRVNGGKLNTHNYYLFLAVNLGFIALLIYVIYVLYNIRVAFKHDQFYYLIFAILFILEGFFTHNLFHERPVVLTLAFFDAQVYNKYLKPVVNHNNEIFKHHPDTI